MARRPYKIRPKGRSLREFLKVFWPVLLLTAAGFWLAYQFVEPAPPKLITVATGSKEGAYHAYAERLRFVLARDGVELDILETKGSVENIGLLERGENPVDLAFVQSGTGAVAAGESLRSLASLYFEPLWVFTRKDLEAAGLIDLSGLKLAIGATGSGTRLVAERLLVASGVGQSPTELLPLSGTEAAAALYKGEVDAVFLVTSASSGLVQELLRSPEVALLSFQRAEAISRRFRYLSKVELPEGVVDLAANIPDRDVRLLAPAATLVAQEDLHPALADLVMIAIKELGKKGDLFSPPGQFPSTSFLEFPIADEAQRFFEKGPPFLQNYLPFWAANLVERMLILLVPLITLMIPLLRILPPTYRWSVRKKIYRWYEGLESIDDRMIRDATKDDLIQCTKELDRIETDVRQVTVPLSYSDELYHLRMHIDFLRGRLEKAKTRAVD